MWGPEGQGVEFMIKREVLTPLTCQIWWGMYALGVYGPKGPKYVKICTSFVCMAAVGTCRGSRGADGSSRARWGIMWGPDGVGSERMIKKKRF